MQDIKWLFFDVGSTLVDESEVYRKRFGQIAERAGVSFEEVLERSLDYYREGKKGDKETASFYGVELPQWDPSPERTFPDAEECLIKLSKHYKIGVIANQQLGAAQRLEEYGLLKYIDLVVASAEEGVAKPDLRIFCTALDRSGCSAENAVMIGDRMDNDIIPADRMGMKTVRVMQGLAASDKSSYDVTPDYTVNSLTELCELLTKEKEYNNG